MIAPIVRLTLIIVGTAVYLGLAVLGCGGLAAFFSNPALIALALATFAMAGASLSYLPAWSDRTGFWIIDGDAVRWLGSFSSRRAARFASGPSSCSASGSAG